MTILLQMFLLFWALAGSAFFSASEMALISANPIRVRHRAKIGQAAAKRAARIVARREQYLIMFIIGQAALNVLTAAVTTGLLDRLVPFEWLAALIAIFGVTIVVVVIAEIVPKVIGQQLGGRFLMRHGRLLEVFHYLVMPLSQLGHLYLKMLLRLTGQDRKTPFVTRDELRVLVSEAEVHDGSGHQEKRMLESILDLKETVAREVMIPMNQVLALEKGTKSDIWRAMVRRHGYTRIPVFEKRRDRVVGVVNIFDLIYDATPKESLDEYIREVPIVPDTKRIDHLMVELQKTRSPMAVVVDEFGACIGVVTVEDIVEEIVGEMADEHERSFRKIRKLAPGVYLAEGLTDIDDLNQELELKNPLPKGRYDTLGGLILSKAGRVPREGERYGLHGVTIEVLDADAYAVRTVKITLPEGEVS